MYLRTLLLGLIFSLAYGQVGWLQVYGGLNNDEFTSIDIQNNILAVGGITDSWGAGLQDGWLLRVDPLTGNIIWSKTWGYSTDEWIYDVAVHSNGTIVYSGEGFRDGWNDVFLAGVDATGTLLWTQLLPHGLADDVWHIYVEEFVGDTLVVWGDIDAVFFWDIGVWDGYYFKITTSGTIVNQYLYGGVLSNEGTHDMVWQPNQIRYLLNWSFNIGAGSSDFLVAKIDPSGNPVWERTYGTGATEVPWAIFVYSDYLLLVGWMDPGYVGNRDILVMRVDTFGNFQWGMVYGTVSDEQINSAQRMADGTIVLAGWTTTSNGDDDAILIFLDSLGQLRKAVAVGDTGDERFVDVAVDGTSVYASGWTTSWGALGRDGLIVRTDTSGYVPCYWRELAFDSALYFPIVLNQALFHISRGWNQVSGPDVLDNTPQNIFSCISLSQEPTVLLSADLETDNAVKLSWWSYANTEEIVSWVIKRGTSHNSMEEIVTLAGGILNWTDYDVPSSYEVFYVVEGITASGNVIRSNITKVELSDLNSWIVLHYNNNSLKIPYDRQYPVRVVSLSGQEVLSWHGQPFSVVELSNLPSGTYVVVNGLNKQRILLEY